MQEAALNVTVTNIDSNSGTSTSTSAADGSYTSSVDGVFVDYLARTVDADASSYLMSSRNNHINRNSSMNNDDRDYQESGNDNEVEAGSPELNRKVQTTTFLTYSLTD